MGYTEYTLGKMSILSSLYRESNPFFNEWSSNKMLRNFTGVDCEISDHTKDICRRLNLNKMADLVRQKNEATLKDVESKLYAEKIRNIEIGKIRVPSNIAKEEYAACEVSGLLNGLIYFCAICYIEMIALGKCTNNMEKDMALCTDINLITADKMAQIITCFLKECKKTIDDLADEYDISVRYVCDMAGFFDGEYEAISEWIANNTKEGEHVE